MAIHEINSLKEVVKYLTEITYLFLDIDNTLIHTYSTNGCINKEFTKLLHTSGFRFTKSGEFASYYSPKYLELVAHFNKHAAIGYCEPTEQGIGKLMDIWKSKCRVFGLTSRGIELASLTETRLDKFGIYFPRVRNKGHIYIPNKTGRSGITNRRIVYCGGYPKEKVFTITLNTSPLHMPYIITVVDDTRYHLEVLDKIYPNFIGLHYVKK